jgi:SAM-dependent methyltransferase
VTTDFSSPQRRARDTVSSVTRLRAMPPHFPEEEGAAPQHADQVVPLGVVPADYVDRNRAAWERWALDYVASGRRAWTGPELRWGLWGVPESQLGLVSGLPDGADIVELGCGTAAVSAWLARAGMRPVAVDIARKQLDLADRLQRELGPTFPLIHANAEDVPYDTESFDLAISEYGASLWCEPHRWLAEANRLLRLGGGLLFFVNSPVLMACTQEDGSRAGDRLVRDYFASPVREFPEDGVVEFHLTHGNWIALLRAYGFTLERLVEVRPPYGAKPRFDFASLEWARRWPTEDAWLARKTG